MVDIASGSGSSWSVDASSGIGVPANNSEWTAVMSAAGIGSGNPSALHLCQEPSGNLADSIGTFTLTASGTAASYQQAVSGWSRTAVTMTDGATTSFSNTDLGLPDLALSSMLTIAYINMPTANPGSARNLIQNGSNASRSCLEINATPTLIVVHAANQATPAGSPLNAVRPCWVRSNQTADEADGGDDVRKGSPTFGLVAGQRLGLGSQARASAAVGYMYSATFFGAAAEMTDAQIKTLLQTLGWAISW